MGQVYEAVHLELGRRAAIKLLHPSLAKNEELEARFFTEARAASLVAHPGLVHIYEYGRLDDGGAFIAMEFLEGESLRSRQDKCGGRLPAAAVLPLARQLAMSLHAAHAKGVVHRDLKPDNIMLVLDDEVSIGERVKIVDFGIAKMVGDGADQLTNSRTRPGALLGTPSYMAPEQAGSAGGIGPHTDVYSLGAMLFDLLSGQPPFIAEETYQIIGQHMFAAPPSLRSLVPEADPALDELLQRMMAKSPAARPDMRAVASELAKIDGRLRSHASGAVAATVDSSQASTMIFRSSSHDRLPARHFPEQAGTRRSSAAEMRTWPTSPVAARRFLARAVVVLGSLLLLGLLGGLVFHQSRAVAPKPPQGRAGEKAESAAPATRDSSLDTPSKRAVERAPVKAPKPAPTEPQLLKPKPPAPNPAKAAAAATGSLSSQFSRELRSAASAYDNGHCREAITMARTAWQLAMDPAVLQGALVIIGAAGCQCRDNDAIRTASYSLADAKAAEALKRLQSACLRWGYRWNGSYFTR